MSLNDLLTPATMKAHRATWWVNTGERDRTAPCGHERIRRTAKMQGFWPGYVVTCSCGEDSKTDGQLRHCAEEWLFDHRYGAQTDAEALARACPACHAQPGHPCTGNSGFMHPERYQEGA